MDPHREYLEARFAQGCRKPVPLWEELRTRGFTGSRATVRDALARLNVSTERVPGAELVRTMPCPSVRKTFGWLVGWRKLGACEPKREEHRQFVDILCRNEPMIAQARRLAREFLGIIHRRDLPRFDRWLGRLQESGVPELKRYAASLETDLSAVRAAFALPWSNGQVEGHVNRLKYLKRQMYGRASVELLRLRVLHSN
ncbi:MAG: transposase [Sterolibacteriaceae bacterium]|nr:transposase [Sterolibacteriaceae bacterium]